MLPELTTIVAIIYEMLSNYLDVILNQFQSLEHRLDYSDFLFLTHE